ncbi:hypothetical protein [Streptomyces tubercidicus]|uniref:hypothetical protein n=1 Tax=Streptomyces tubercidicus TaxID=47759 RepID=UPI002E11EF97|nr:hypothetical protein OG761_21535 [Streptomyces tubercidicus]
MAPSGGSKRRSQRRAGSSSPRRTLPTYRANPRQQFNILLGLADLDTGTTPVQRTALAQHIDIGAATVGDCMTFLADIGLVQAGRGQYALTERGREFAAAWRCDRAQARLLLHPLLAAHWSAAAATRLLANGPVPQEELARLLRDDLPGVPMRGHYMVEWLDIALIVERDEERLEVRLPTPDAPKSTQPPGPKAQEEHDEEQSPRRGDRDGAAGSASGGPQSVGDVALLLGMSRPEIQDLPDARYAAFLEGILATLRGVLAPTA